MPTIQDLRESLVEINEAYTGIQNRADTENRPLSEDEQSEFDAKVAEFQMVESDIERRETILQQSNRLATMNGDGNDGNRTDPKPSKPNVINTHGKAGYRHFGEFAADVVSASAKGGHVPERLISMEGGANESVGSEGGWALPPAFRSEIMSMILDESNLAGLCDPQVSSSNRFVAPVDETTPWQEEGGIQSGWVAEGKQATKSKPKLKQIDARLHKNISLIPVTDELLEDAPSMDRYLRQKAPSKLSFAVDLSIVRGTGAGMPLGFLNSDALVTVAKESGQTADTLVYKNLVKMWSQMYAPSRANAVWLINQDIEPQLFSMSFEGNSSSVPAYLPANGLSASPYGTLFGRPVIPHQAMGTIGSLGDIAFVDLSKYLLVTKTQGVRTDVSIHLYFDFDETAFRFTVRVAGQPWWSKPIDPRDGSKQLSPFVALAERA